MNLINTLNYCTNLLGGEGIPTSIGKIIHMIVLVIQVVVPILLIIWGMLDFAKGIIGSDEDKIKAGQKKFIQRVIAAVIVFLIVVVVRLVITTVGTLGDNQGESAWHCADELISAK